MRILPYITSLSPVDNLLWRLRSRLNLPYGAENRITEKPWRHKFKTILKFIEKDYNADTSNNSGKKPSVLMLAVYGSYRVFQMDYYNKSMYSPVSLNLNRYMDFIKEDIFRDKYHYIITEKSMYFLYPNCKQAYRIKKALKLIGENQKKFDQRYQAIKEIGLPEGLTAVIYKKLNQKHIK